MSDWTLHLGDCIEGMKALADKSVDHVITDPPYAPRAMKNVTTASMVQRRDGVVYDFGYSALDPMIRDAAAIQFARLARRWVVVWCDIESVTDWKNDLEDAGLRYIRAGVWVRVNGCPQFSGDRPAQGVEACVIAHNADTKLAWNGGGRPATWTGPIVNSQHSSRIHSSPKPEWLMESQVRDFTDRGELILDPFAGSGTTLVAAVKLGRNALGWELSQHYHDAATRRLVNTREQLGLFAEGA